MNLGQQILFFFGALGVFNGFIISIYLLALKRPLSTTSGFLGLFLLSLCLKISKSFIFYFYPDLPGIYIQIGILCSSWVGPSLFYFIKSASGLSQNNLTIAKCTYAFWTGAIIAVSLIAPYDSYPGLWNDYVWTIVAAQFTIYNILCAWLLKSTFIKVLKREQLPTTEKLLLSVFIANLIVPLAFKLPIFSFFNGYCISGALFFSLALYLNAFLFMNKRRGEKLFSGKTEAVRYANKKINEQQAVALTTKLDRMISEGALYKNPDLKLNDLASKMGISGHQLSQLLNDNLGKSFAAYINEYRVNEACQMIAKQQHIKLEAIGYEVGFNSKSTFYSTFKKHKNTTPTLYKEQLSVIVVS